MQDAPDALACDKSILHAVNQHAKMLIQEFQAFGNAFSTLSTYLCATLLSKVLSASEKKAFRLARK